MSIIQTCADTKDTLDLFRGQGLYLKPVAKLNISVQLPQLKKSGAKISNWEVMERAKEMARPYNFPVFKVAKSSLEFIRFEAEIENYGAMETVLAKLDMKTIKLSGFTELLKIRAAEAKPVFPSRHDWDSFFRNNKAMNEMKPGERPDTIYLKNLPTKWFLNQQDRSGVAKDKPSEFVLKKVFGTFGDIRAIDIPLLDPYRQLMKSSISGIQTFNFEQDLVFDAYIQFKEYVGFVKAMNSLKGMKLCFKDRYEDKAWVANIKVDFDKTKHLAESTIKKRSEERDKLAAQERDREDKERRKRDLEELKRAQELRKLEAEEKDRERKVSAEKALKMERRMEREQRRRAAKAQRKNQTQEEAMAEKIAVEERKLLIAQRKLESIRLLDELLDRVKVIKSKEKKVRGVEADLLKTAAKQAASAAAARKGGKAGAAGSPLMTYKDKDEQMLRDKLINRLKEKEVSKMEMVGIRLRNAKENNRFDSDDEGAGMSVEDISEDDLEEQQCLEMLAKISRAVVVREESAVVEVAASELAETKKEDDEGLDESFEANDKIASDDDYGDDNRGEGGGKGGPQDDEDLRLTSTDEEEAEKEGAGDDGLQDRSASKAGSNNDNSTNSPKAKKSKKSSHHHKSSKKSKKEKKSKKSRDRDRSRSRDRDRGGGRSSRGGDRDKDKDEDDDKARKRREIASHIAEAKKISDREKRELQRDQEREARGEKVVRGRGPIRFIDPLLDPDGYPDYRERMRDKMQERREQERAEKRAAERMKEHAKEDLYDRMMHPHLYRDRIRTPSPLSSRGGMRPVRKGEHYEQVQKEYLENEIRIKERRERRDRYEREAEFRDRERDRERRHAASAARDRDYDRRGGGGGGYDPRDHHHHHPRDQPHPRDVDIRQMGRADRSRSRFDEDRRSRR